MTTRGWRTGGVAVLMVTAVLAPRPAAAQFGLPGIPQVVFDPKAVAQAIAIAKQASDQYRLWVEMTRGLPSVGRYVTPTLAPAEIIETVLDRIPPEDDGAGWPVHTQRRRLALTATDARLKVTVTQAARVQAFLRALAPLMARFSADATSGAAADRSLAAGLDKLSAAQIIAQQQQDAAQSVAIARLNLETARAVRDRDADALTIRMDLAQQQYGAQAVLALVGDDPAGR